MFSECVLSRVAGSKEQAARPMGGMSAIMTTRVRVRRAELKAALELDRVVSSAAGGQEQAAQPSLRTLASLAFAVGLPFIGFGFFDNFIMVRRPARPNPAAAVCCIGPPGIRVGF